MAWFRRKPPVARVDVGTYVDPPDQDPPALEDLVDEAQLIAEQAVRLALANALLRRALRDDLPYSEADMLALAREQFEHVAAEAQQDAVRKTRSVAGDSDRRERRKAVSTGLAERLRELSTDQETLQRVIDRARESALDDILTAYVSVARRRRTQDPAELARRQAMVALDLQDLRPGY